LGIQLATAVVTGRDDEKLKHLPRRYKRVRRRVGSPIIVEIGLNSGNLAELFESPLKISEAG
jgi:hypothetical protein